MHFEVLRTFPNARSKPDGSTDRSPLLVSIAQST